MHRVKLKEIRVAVEWPSFQSPSKEAIFPLKLGLVSQPDDDPADVVYKRLPNNKMPPRLGEYICENEDKSPVVSNELPSGSSSGKSDSQNVDFWTAQGDFLVRHHVVPRLTLFALIIMNVLCALIGLAFSESPKLHWNRTRKR